MTRIHDVLSDLLDGSRLRGQVFCQAVARPPWSVRFAARPEAIFHLVTAGTALLIAGRTTLALAQGDLVLLSRGDAHALADHPASKPIDLATWIATHDPREPMMRIGGSRGPETRSLCGAYQFDGLGIHHPVLRLLPPVVHLAAARTRADLDLAATLSSLAREQERGTRGSAVIVSRLLDVAFVQIVRAWADDQPLGGAGWIGALTDTMLARALSAMHGDLGRAWDVDELARAAATSRATLGRRFAAAIGEPPLSYLTRARMQQAAQRIRSSDAALGEIAGEVGYHSEFAFNRAFRRVFGVPPGTYRRSLRAPAAAPPDPPGTRLPRDRRER